MIIRFPRKVRIELWVIFVIGLTVLAMGCTTTHVLHQNKQAAYRLGLLFRANENNDAGWYYPPTLQDLTKELKAAGIEAALPQCKCADGTLRDLDYISGFTS